MRWRWELVLAGAVLVGVAGCGSGDTVKSSATQAPPSKVDFATQVQPIFTQYCAISGCHSAAYATQDLVLESGQAYANIVNVESVEVGPQKRVEPGHSAESFLYQKISMPQPPSGDRMPLTGGPLPDDKIALIKVWIDEGAKPAATTAAGGTHR